MRLNKKQKRKIRREVELDLDFISPKSAIYRNKKKYYRKVKHKKNDQRRIKNDVSTNGLQ